MTTAFHGDPAVKAALTDRIDRHAADGTLRFGATGWDGAGGSALGVATEGGDIAAFADRYGYPLVIAGVIDPMAALLRAPDRALAFVRAAIVPVAVGADLSGVATRIVLAMLDAIMEHDVVGLIALHRRALAGKTVARHEWSAVRGALLDRMDRSEDARTRRHLALAEAASWPAGGSRSILATMVGLWIDLPDAALDAAWPDADRARAQTLLDGLWTEQAAARDRGEESDYPALFHARDPDLARRFEDNLARENTLHARRLGILATMMAGEFAAASVRLDSAA